MAVSYDSQSKTILINYIPVLGALFTQNELNKEVLDKAREAAGAQQTDTFMGKTGDSVSAKVWAAIKEHIKTCGGENQIVPTAVGGVYSKITWYAREDERGNKIPKVNIFLTGKDDTQVQISLDVQHAATPTVLRKLVNVLPGTEITLNLFATYSKKGDGKWYTDHGCTIKTGGQEVPACQVRLQQLKDAVAGAQKLLQNQGFTDKQILRTAAKTATANYCETLVAELASKFQNRTQSESGGIQQDAESAEPPAAAAKAEADASGAGATPTPELSTAAQQAIEAIKAWPEDKVRRNLKAVNNGFEAQADRNAVTAALEARLAELVPA